MIPKVSVVMPIFRHSKEQLTNAIYSILNQSFKNLELIVVDGSSADINRKVITSINDERIRYYKVKGYINCLNYGIEMARGIYIARMDSDDISLPTRIEEQVNFLDNNPDISLCSCLVEYYGKRCSVSKHRNEITLLNLIKCQEFVHPAMMFRKSINIKYEHFKPLEDCLLFRKLLLEGHKFAIIDKVLYKNYFSSTSIMEMYHKYCSFLLNKMDIWALVKYYNYNLSFIDKILYSKVFSEKEVIEYLAFISFLKKELKHTNLKLTEICLPFFSFMVSKLENYNFLFFSDMFYKTIVPLYLEIILKNCLKFIFSITNSWYETIKIKVICIFGVKIKFKIPKN